MKKRNALWGCSIALVFLFFIVIAGGWLYFRPQLPVTDAPPPSTVLVFLTTPNNGDEVTAGDFVPVTVKAIAPTKILSAELFVDGQLLGKVTESPENATWTWQAWPLGVHTLSARVITVTDGGESQNVFVNVLAGDGAMQVYAEEGQTLVQVGGNYGIPPDQMAGANPILDPAQPLPGGQPVQVPVSDAVPTNGSENGGGTGNPPGGAGGFHPILVTWQFNPTEPVDKSYCYTSTGDGVWEKMPKDPFEFFAGEVSFYTQVSFDAVNQYGLIQMQCWGWLGGTLKYLGQGETSFDAQEPPNQVAIVGNGFELVGVPEIPPDSGGGSAVIPPPYAVREPKDSAECTAHGHPLFAPFICDTLMNQNPKEYMILVWEWAPENCWPGYCKYDVTEIEGYHIYEIDPVTQIPIYLKQVPGASNKVTAIPLSWGPKCYGVDAYTDSGISTSEIVTFCPGIENADMVTLKMVTAWVTSEDKLSTQGCSMGFQQNSKPGLGIGALLSPGFGSKPGEVFVGAYKYESSGGVLAGSNCYEDAYFNAGVKFDFTSSLPANSVIQKATLRFFVPFQDYLDFSYMTSPPSGTCVAVIGRATSDWSSLIDSDHWTEERLLDITSFSSPAASVSFGPSPQADVTAIVKAWLTNPVSNHGFLVMSDHPPSPSDDGLGLCYSGLSNFELDIYYFAP